MTQDPHASQRMFSAGPSTDSAPGTVVLVHGRGATAQSMLSLYTQLELPTLAALAPQAADNTWYPYSFLAPLQANQPYLESALDKLNSIVAGLMTRGMPSERIA